MHLCTNRHKIPFETTMSISIGLKLMKERLSRLSTEEGRLKGLSFTPRSSDVLVVTPPKCGTTWMQQIVHQLRTGGDMEFREITEVVPWIELAHDEYIDIEADQKQVPRCYKTHCWYDHCPKGGKYIVIYREPCAVFYSFFKFFQGWYFQPGEVLLDEFVKDLILSRGKPKNKLENASYHEHLLSWWKHRNDPNVLMLFFEEMKEDLETVVKVVASFMGIDDEEKIHKAVKMSSFEFMKANSEKFNCNLEILYRNKACGLPEGMANCADKILTGSVTEAADVLSDSLKEDIQREWRETVTSTIGFKTYDELRVAFRKEKPLQQFLNNN